MNRIFFPILWIGSTIVMLSCENNITSKNVGFKLTNDMLADLKFSKVRIENIEGQIELTGKVIPDENNLVNIYPMVGGKVTMVDVEIGEKVSTQKPLVVINSGEAREFEKQYIAAKDDYEFAKRNYEIQKELNETKFNSERELTYAKKDYQLAKAELARLKQVYNVYSLTEGGNYVIKSPVSGFVVEKKIGVNMQIRPDMSDYILSVARLDEVFISLNIYESDLSKIKKGDQVKIKSFSYPDSIVYGTIDRIENIIDPISKTNKARVKISNPNYLFKPEMNCVGLVKYKENNKMLTIPKEALIFDKSKYFVMVYHNRNKIETREVEIFSESDEYAYIKSGLKLNEKIISKNQLFIYDALND